MPTDALIAVLAGAVLHASWNAAIKSGQDKLLDTTLVAASAAIIAALVLPFLSMPTTASVPYLVSSAGLQVLYFLLVAAAYHTGDMGQAYPLMRGAAPLLVAVASGALLGEHLSMTAWVGITLVCGGVLTLALFKGSSTANAASTKFALANSFVIAGYTFIDGVGVRLSGQPPAYTLWVFFLTGLPLLAWAVWKRPRELVKHASVRWTVGLGGGACTVGSYGLALWAMTRAPIATAAALRETSILFGMLLAAFVLKEKVSSARLASGIAIALGAATLRIPS